MSRNRKVSKQKKRNSWYIVYRVPGRPSPIWEPVGLDEDVAERRRLEKMAELVDSDYIEPSRDKFSVVAEEWWSVVAVANLAESTQLDYRSILDFHLLPKFGQQPISKIKYRQIQRFVAEKQSSVSNKRIRNILIVLSDVFTYACKCELCRENPVDKVDRPSIEKAEVEILQPDEIWRLFAAVKEIQPYYAALVITAVMTGMRLGELRPLTWDKVDFDRNEIRVRCSQARKKVKNPKTDAGWRTVPMSMLVREVLVEQHAKFAELTDLVFPSHRLTPFDASNVRQHVLYKSLEHAELRRVKWHSLRHSAASLMARAKADEKQVQAILGHSSIQVTKDLYTHLFEDARRDAIDRMEQYMLSTKPENPEKAEEVRAVYAKVLTLPVRPDKTTRDDAA